MAVGCVADQVALVAVVRFAASAAVADYDDNTGLGNFESFPAAAVPAAAVVGVGDHNFDAAAVVVVVVVAVGDIGDQDFVVVVAAAAVVVVAVGDVGDQDFAAVVVVAAAAEVVAVADADFAAAAAVVVVAAVDNSVASGSSCLCQRLSSPEAAGGFQRVFPPHAAAPC